MKLFYFEYPAPDGAIKNGYCRAINEEKAKDLLSKLLNILPEEVQVDDFKVIENEQS